MTCNRKSKQHRQIQCSRVFRLFQCSGVFQSVPAFQCSGVPVFRGVLVFLVLVHAIIYRVENCECFSNQDWYYYQDLQDNEL